MSINLCLEKNRLKWYNSINLSFTRFTLAYFLFQFTDFEQESEDLCKKI